MKRICKLPQGRKEKGLMKSFKNQNGFNIPRIEISVFLYFFLPRQKSNSKLFPANAVQKVNRQTWTIWESFYIKKKEIEYLIHVNKLKDFHK